MRISIENLIRATLAGAIAAICVGGVQQTAAQEGDAIPPFITTADNYDVRFRVVVPVGHNDAQAGFGSGFDGLQL